MNKFQNAGRLPMYANKWNGRKGRQLIAQKPISSFDPLNLPKKLIRYLFKKPQVSIATAIYAIYPAPAPSSRIFFLLSLHPFISLLGLPLPSLSLPFYLRFGKIPECAISLPLTRATVGNTVSCNFIVHQTESRQDLVGRVKWNNIEILWVSAMHGVHIELFDPLFIW